jgi:GMP reductase
MKHYFDFDDVTLIPQFFNGTTRKNIDVSCKLGKFTFNVPVVPANMQSVMSAEIAEKLALENYFYIMHRFYDGHPQTWINDMVSFCRNFKQKELVTSISVGVKDIDRKLIKELVTNNLIPDFITIDIAHGHSKMMKDMISFIREEMEDDVFIIGGNVSTNEACVELYTWGVNAIKVGIAPGSACLTYQKTSFGSRGIQASTVKSIADFIKLNNFKLALISDGGIKQNGHIACALAMGANMVMVGGLFSKCIDSPSPVLTDINGNLYKEYWGSASAKQKGENVNVEGTTLNIELSNNTIIEELNYMKEDLQSALSYNGDNKLNDFIGNVNYIIKN